MVHDTDEDSVWVIGVGNKRVREEVIHLLRQLGSESFVAVMKVLRALLVRHCGRCLMPVGCDLATHASDTDEDGKRRGPGIAISPRACRTGNIVEEVHPCRLVVAEIGLRSRHAHQNLITEGQGSVAPHSEEPVKAVRQPNSPAPFLDLGPGRLVLGLSLVRGIRGLVADELDQAEGSACTDPTAPEVLEHELVDGQQEPGLYIFNPACEGGTFGGELFNCPAAGLVCNNTGQPSKHWEQVASIRTWEEPGHGVAITCLEACSPTRLLGHEPDMEAAYIESRGCSGDALSRLTLPGPT